MSGHQRAISGSRPISASRGRSSSRSGRSRNRSPFTGRDYAAGVKKRLDVLLVERGLAESRAQAQALVLAGRVPGYAKPGLQVADDAELEVTAPPRYVSRGGE